MSKVKAGGTAKNLHDSNPKYLGVKANHLEPVKAGSVIVRQRGTKFIPGENVGLGTDHTIFALKDGRVEMSEKRITHFDGSIKRKKVISVK